MANSLKIFFRTVGARGEQKAVSKSLRGPFSSLFEATSCDQYFSDYASCEGMKNHNFNAKLLIYYWFKSKKYYGQGKGSHALGIW
jgi:hypothetical protein